MTAITVSGGTPSVSSATTSGYPVDRSGTLDVVGAGVVSGLMTVSGNQANVYVVSALPIKTPQRELGG